MYKFCLLSSTEMLNKIEIVIQNRVSVSGSLLYIDGHVPHFRCLKANLANDKFVFPNRYETLLTLFPH